MLALRHDGWGFGPGPRRRLGALALLAAFIVAISRPAEAVDFRIEAGVGLVYSDYDLSFSERSGPFELVASSDSALGGSGLIVSAAGWIDGVLFRDLSIGLEYLRTETDSELSFDLSASGQNVTLDSDFSLDIDTLFLNVAWRYNAEAIHPYAGLGLGISWLDGTISGQANASFVGGDPTGLFTEDVDAIAPSGQAFLGFDYDVTSLIYLGAEARYYIIDGHLFGVDQVIRELSGQVKVGVRF